MFKYLLFIGLFYPGICQISPGVYPGSVTFDSFQTISAIQFNCITQYIMNNTIWDSLKYIGFNARIYTSAGQLDNIGINNINTAFNIMYDVYSPYISPCVNTGCPSPRNQFTTSFNALNAIPDAPGAQAQYYIIYIDVAKTIWSNNITYNRDFLRQMIYQSTVLEATVGIYTNAQDWEAVFGEWSEFSSLPLWWNQIGSQDLDGFLPFGGWTLYNVVRRQYNRNINACGLIINLTSGPKRIIKPSD